MPPVGAPNLPPPRKPPTRPAQDVLSRLKGRVALPAAYSAALSAGQQADRIREGNVSDSYEHAMRTEGGTGKGAIRTIPKSYTQTSEAEGDEGYLPTDLEQRQGVRAREEAMRESMASFSGVERQGLASVEGEGPSEEGQQVPIGREQGQERPGEEPLSPPDQRQEAAAMAAMEAGRQASLAAEEAGQEAMAQGADQEQQAKANEKKKEAQNRKIAQFITGSDAALGTVDGIDLVNAAVIANLRMVNTHTFKSKALPSTTMIEDAGIITFDFLVFIMFLFSLAMTVAIVLILFGPLILGVHCTSGVSNAAGCASGAIQSAANALAN